MAQPSDTQSSDTISRARPRGGGKKQGKGRSCLPQTNIGDCGGGSLLSFVCGLLGGVGLGMVEEGLARATEGQASDYCPATGGGAGQDIDNLVEFQQHLQMRARTRSSGGIREDGGGPRPDPTAWSEL